QAEKGRAERECDVASNPAADPRAEVWGGHTLKNAQVNLAGPIHAVKTSREQPVELEQWIAAHKLTRVVEVRQLQVISRNGVAQIAIGEKAIRQDAIQQFFDHQLKSRLFRRVRCPDPNVVKGIGQDRTETRPQALFALPKGVVDQPAEVLTIRFRQ